MISPAADKTEEPPPTTVAHQDAADAMTKAEDGPDSSGSNPTATEDKGDNDGDRKEKEEDEQEEQAEATFPQQLMDVIDSEAKDGCGFRTAKDQLVIEWLPEGESFVIRDKAKLEAEVLPKYFHAKCKFMSFVRKLYRWGFRQIDKSHSSGMVFTHPNFVRGERKRCLMMRSIVKKQSNNTNQHAQPQVNQPYGGMMGAMTGDANFMKGFDATGQFNGPYGMGMGMGMGGSSMGGFGPPLFPQQVRQVSYPGSGSNQGPGDSMMNSGSLGGFGGGSFMPNQGAMGIGGMTSRDVFEAGLRLQRMEREQQQRMGMLDNTSGPPMSSFKGYNDNRLSSTPASSFSPPMMSAMGGGNNSYGSSSNTTGSGPSGEGMTQIDIASQLMKRDPSMEPWKALEMAKHFNSSSNSMC